MQDLLSPLPVPVRDRLIFALDVPDVATARAYVDMLGDTVEVYKVGLELFMSGYWFELVRDLKEMGKQVFADLKLFDIPATVGRAVRRLRELEMDFATVHGNDAILAAAVEEKGSTRILAVTALTSLDEHDLADLGFQVGVQELVESRARRALEIGCDGVVSSGLEAPMLRREHGSRIVVVTPGVRPVANVDDQKRAVSIETALRNGADYIVVGRPIRDAEDPQAAAADCQRTIAEVLASAPGMR